MGSNYNKILDAIIQYLGDHNPEKYEITLYDVPTSGTTVNDLRNKVTAITDKFKFIILSPKEEYTNIKILDIDL